MSIRLRGITKVYRMGEERINALAGVDLEISANEWVAIMGASGSGKSTLMNIIGCLDRPTSGVYVLDEQVVSRMGAVRLAEVRNKSIGFVFQSFELMPRLTALKNVELPLIYARHNFIARRKMATAALERVGLQDRMNHRPNQLSGGQKQRVAIARALVHKPTILLADEPTGNLDSRTTEEILELFRQLHEEGQTIVMVTHEEDVAGFASRIVRMLDGKVVSDLPTAEDRRTIGAGGIQKTKLNHEDASSGAHRDEAGQKQTGHVRPDADQENGSEANQESFQVVEALPHVSHEEEQGVGKGAAR